ncbi:hypothetical protein HDV00_001605 [Rhizophlyctis rosea]|nr:hypothetical protein HDV00_001605 [Rhizophlyctis rosea]
MTARGSFGYRRNGLDVFATNDVLLADQWIKRNFEITVPNGVRRWRHKICGLDCEKGRRDTLKCVQLAAPSGDVLVYHCVRKNFPQSMRRLMQSTELIKTGEGVEQDAQLMRQAGFVHINGIVELSTVVNLYREHVLQQPGPHQPQKLVAMAHEFLGIFIKNDFDSAWGYTDALDEESVIYASLDAFASLKVPPLAASCAANVREGGADPPGCIPIALLFFSIFTFLDGYIYAEIVKPSFIGFFGASLHFKGALVVYVVLILPCLIGGIVLGYNSFKVCSTVAAPSLSPCKLVLAVGFERCWLWFKAGESGMSKLTDLCKNANPEVVAEYIWVQGGFNVFGLEFVEEIRCG